ncbi:hypothetical protein THAOC_15377 [Thalassiosira oceanica]|uniref:Uncharacterized protein n=1 Tax=Thalassiosira oceanica TaxID=159749 RepID=K0T0C4_THAOC|nr:hypothetical protein THAOC_15377 [Thalassiosira oceanica]|eukprot:EJK63937.1 hypothetical protein THAOC_15377 [Thalassiosira oceanica]
MAMESPARSDDDAGFTGSPPRPFPPGNVSAQETGGGTDVDRSTAEPLAKDTPHGRMSSTIHALNDDDPPAPVDHEKESEVAQLIVPASQPIAPINGEVLCPPWQQRS